MSMQVSLASDYELGGNTRQSADEAELIDPSVSPFLLASKGKAGKRQIPSPKTPRQRIICERLELPVEATALPVPPGCSAAEWPEQLQVMYWEFALDLHAGVVLSQLKANNEYSDIHCQLMDDMVTLKLDQNSGRIVEFPLTGVSKVYRLIKNGDNWYNEPMFAPFEPSGNAEFIVVMDFMHRKLAFVFSDVESSHRFLTCMELLVRRAHAQQAKIAMNFLAPTMTAQIIEGNHCPSPRQAQTMCYGAVTPFRYFDDGS